MLVVEGTTVAETPISGAKELQGLLVDYAKQETVDPLRSLGKFLGLGLAGAVLAGLGAIFLGLGTLRLLQSLITDAGGSWSLIPYGVAILVLAAIIGIVATLLRSALKKVKLNG